MTATTPISPEPRPSLSERLRSERISRRAVGALLALVVVGACASAPGPRETRLVPGAPLAEALGRPVEVSGIVGANLTLDEIRRGTIEPRCAEVGLVMASMRVRRRPDGAQAVEARCAPGFLPATRTRLR